MQFYQLLVLSLVLSSSLFSMDFDMNFNSSYEPPSSVEIAAYSDLSDWGNQDYSYPEFYTRSYSESKETDHQVFVNLQNNCDAMQNKDCVSLINQQIVESTGTDEWAARAYLSAEKHIHDASFKRPKSWKINGDVHHDVIPGRGVFSVWGGYLSKKTRQAGVTFSIRAYNAESTNYSHNKEVHIPIFYGSTKVNGVAINPKCISRCAVSFQDGNVRIFDIHAEKEIHCFNPNNQRNLQKFNSGTPDLHDALAKPLYTGNFIYHATPHQIFQWDDRHDAGSNAYTEYDGYTSIDAIARHNGALYVVTSWLGESRTLNTLNRAQQRLEPFWSENKRSIPGDKRYTYDYLSTRLACSDQYIVMTGVKSVIIIDRINKKIQSYQDFGGDAFVSGLEDFSVALDDKNSLHVYNPKSNTVEVRDIKKLLPSEVGLHINNIRGAAVLRVLHQEVKQNGGPVCNQGLKAFPVNEDDYSPTLLSIMKAQGVDPFDYFKEPRTVDTSSRFCQIQ